MSNVPELNPNVQRLNPPNFSILFGSYNDDYELFPVYLYAPTANLGDASGIAFVAWNLRIVSGWPMPAACPPRLRADEFLVRLLIAVGVRLKCWSSFGQADGLARLCGRCYVCPRPSKDHFVGQELILHGGKKALSRAGR